MLGAIIGIVAGYFGGWVDRVPDGGRRLGARDPVHPDGDRDREPARSKADDWPLGRESVLILVIGVARLGGHLAHRAQPGADAQGARLRASGRACSARATARSCARHILPGVLPLVLRQRRALSSSISVLAETTLSFLGLGDPEHFSWGQMLNDAYDSGAMTEGKWAYFIPPGLCVTLLAMAFSLVGYALEEIVNPTRRRARMSATDGQERHAAGRARSARRPTATGPARSSRSSTASVSRCAAARRSVWPASRAAARPPRRSRCSACCRAGCAARAARSTLNSKRGVMLLHRRTPTGWRDLRWKTASMVFQGAMNALDPVMRIDRQIAEAIVLHEPGADPEDRVAELLERVGIPSARRRQYPHEFSGGMRQRVMIALALACGPELIIGDEPTTALDVMTQGQILQLLEELRRDLGLALLLITHDLSVIAETCDRVADHVRRADRRARAGARHPRVAAAPVHRAAAGGLLARRRPARARRGRSQARRRIRARTSPAAASHRAVTSRSRTASRARRRCSIGHTGREARCLLAKP